MSISEETFNKIKKENIEQKPRWQFDLLAVSKWIAIVLTTVFASLTFAIVLEYTLGLDLDLYSQSKDFFLTYFVANIPTILIILLVILSMLLYFEFKNTNKGYKYDKIFLIGGVFGLVFIIGITFISIGLSKSTSQNTPFNLFTPNANNYWVNPEYGLISGEVISLSSKKFEIRDTRGIIWHIYPVNRIPITQYSNGTYIRAVGLSVGNNNFLAREIRKVSNQEYKIFILR